MRFHIGHRLTKMPTLPSGDPVAAMDVHAAVGTLLIATSHVLKLQVPFRGSKLVNCPNTNGISDVRVGPKS